jgi:hypothetical protein
MYSKYTQAPSQCQAPNPHSERLAQILADPIAAIEEVRRQNPLLGTHGFGRREPFHKGDQETNFQRNRDDMTRPHQAGQFVRAVQWLATRNSRKTLNTDHSSYGLKHTVEAWHRSRQGYHADVYCSNGMFIAACLALGFRVEPIRWSSINAWTSVGAPLVREKRERRRWL